MVLVAFKFHQPGYKPQAATFAKGTFGAAVHESKATEWAKATGEDDAFREEETTASKHLTPPTDCDKQKFDNLFNTSDSPYVRT